ncbi:MAG: hypothetical protein ORN28_01110 [Rhodoferax sp.]|nr:hypothetical protein [Rhodoferax sp.]
MSAPAPHTDTESQDPVEGIVPFIPVVLPVAGALLMFLLASIAVYMA